MSSPFSYFNRLECSECHREFNFHKVQTFCPDCQAPLVVRYDLDAVKSSLTKKLLTSRPSGMWRWHELLPVFSEENIVSLGEGDTQILPINKIGKELGLPHLFVKDEGRNPTHSFKARGLAAAVSRAKELGLSKLIIPTAGNAGAALATYATKAGMRSCVIMPADTPPENIQQCRFSGAEVILVDGLISDAGKLAQEKAAAEGWFDVSTFKEPYRLEGKKVMGFEIAGQFGWTLPDVIIYPTGGGTGLVGIWKAFHELATLGWLKTGKFPRMIAIQSSGCAPVVKAFEQHSDRCEMWEDARTEAAGLRVPKPFADRMIMRAIYDSGGTAISVSDEQIVHSLKEMAASEGILPCPEGAAPLAALEPLLAAKLIDKSDTILLLVTGSGLTNLHFEH